MTTDIPRSKTRTITPGVWLGLFFVVFAVLATAAIMTAQRRGEPAATRDALSRTLFQAAEASLPQVFSMWRSALDDPQRPQYQGAHSDIIWSYAGTPLVGQSYRYRVVARPKVTATLYEVYFCFDGQRLMACSNPRTLAAGALVNELIAAQRTDLITKFGLSAKPD